MNVVHLKQHTSILVEARRVLKLESYALNFLSQNLDESFIKTIALLQKNKGHVIVTGMGKSGHVGRKIAATLASTGTPAFFVHPAEASHGDLGMVSQDDTILALSNSGETSELSHILAFSRRYGLPLIAITQRAHSALAKCADVCLLLPAVEEACPLGLAPTTSTTMMLALGDAIATSLLKQRDFSPKDFGNLHPGGKLGQILLSVENIMHTGTRIPLCCVADLMQDVILVMSEKSFGTVGVLDPEGNLVGIITDGDLRRHMGQDLLNKQAQAVMTECPLTINISAVVEEALALMNEKKKTCLFVVDAGTPNLKPVGIIHIHDCLRVGVS